MKGLQRGIGVLLAVLLLFVAVPSVGYACSCESYPVLEQLERKQEVFLGEVIKNNPRETRSPDGLQELVDVVTFSVRSSYKGAAVETVVVEFPLNYSSCGVPIKEGGEYIVFASDQDGKLTTGMCDGTMPVLSRNGIYTVTELSKSTILIALAVLVVAGGWVYNRFGYKWKKGRL